MSFCIWRKDDGDHSQMTHPPPGEEEEEKEEEEMCHFAFGEEA